MARRGAKEDRPGDPPGGLHLMQRLVVGFDLMWGRGLPIDVLIDDRRPVLGQMLGQLVPQLGLIEWQLAGMISGEASFAS